MSNTKSIDRIEKWVNKELSEPSHDWEYASGGSVVLDIQSLLKRYRAMEFFVKSINRTNAIPRLGTIRGESE